MHPPALRVATIFLALACCSQTPFVLQADEPPRPSVGERLAKKRTPAETRKLKEVVNDAFAAAHEGWSSDEVVLDDDLNKSFIARCRAKLSGFDTFEFNWTLLNLRKAGQLTAKSTRRRRDSHDDYAHAAEIAARHMEDKHKLNMDRVICDPVMRAEFDKLAAAIAPGTKPYLLRKAAFGLRKARRLRPELVNRVADWGKTVKTFSADSLIKDANQIPATPGVYIFRDQTGYLYIGESSQLRTRVAKHLDHSDRKSLAHYLWKNGPQGITVELHSFDPESPARLKSMRRAYESELIRSRKPRLNIAS
ncbi:MAG: GIY-YIG nuclease family protein [Planctomycetota bacterium]|nr:GIY-YIG nuclease family protein [Planctomycetota bacterium]